MVESAFGLAGFERIPERLLRLRQSRLLQRCCHLSGQDHGGLQSPSPQNDPLGGFQRESRQRLYDLRLRSALGILSNAKIQGEFCKKNQ